MGKTATLLRTAKRSLPKHFFVRTLEESGEYFESADYNLYKQSVNDVIKKYEEDGYRVISTNLLKHK